MSPVPRFSLALCLVAGVAFAGPVIVIDAGHGGDQTGAVSPSGALEKHLALALAKRVKAELERELGATVVLTRTRDVAMSLAERVRVANAARPALFISIHANSMPTRRQRMANEGIETYFLSASATGQARSVAARENAEPGVKARAPSGDTLSFILADLEQAEAHHDSSRLAYAIHESLIAATGAADRGVLQAPFTVLMGQDAPAVLVEVGYLSHPREGPQLMEEAHQATLAGAIVDGVARFLGQVARRDGRSE